MTKAKNIIITANSKNSVLQYRADLIKSLQHHSIDVTIASNFTTILWFLTHPRNNSSFISSDGKSNILMLLFCSLNGMIILNGLGRYERSKFIRSCIIALLKRRKNVRCVAQSYRDYRYFSKHVGYQKVTWIPGSGGTKRITRKGPNKRALLISRDNKFTLLDHVNLNGKYNLDIDIIGLSQTWRQQHVQSLGRSTQDNLFRNHDKFIQLYYYGEGTPHTLVDAFSSNMQIYIDRKSYRNFGIYKYIKAAPYNANLLILKPNTHSYKTYRNLTSTETVTALYVNEVLK